MPTVVSTATLPRDADRVVVLVNPKSGATASGPRADALAGQLKEHGFVAEVVTDLAEAASKANQWHAEGRLRALVGAGGDGTAAELVNRTADGVPIAVLPSGNSNLLAGYFGIGKDPAALCQTIIDGAVARMDAGCANGRVFLLMASCGFDADVVRRLHSRRTGHVSNRSYLKPIVEAAGKYEFPEIRVTWDDAQDVPVPASARWLFVFNLPCYGGGFRIAPHADGADGMLDVCMLRRGSFWPGIVYATAIVLRSHHLLRDWTTREVRRARITSDGEVPYQLDGDPGGILPLDVEVLPGRLSLIVPSISIDRVLS